MTPSVVDVNPAARPALSRRCAVRSAARWRTWCAVLALALGCLAWSAARADDAKPLELAEVAPGITHAAVDLPAEPVRGHVFEVDLTRVDLRVLPAGELGERRTVEEITAALPQHLATNASFFDENRRVMGRVVDQGRTLHVPRLAPWGALVVEQGSARIVLGRSLPPEGGGGDLVVQGLPRLVVEGRVVKLKRQTALRTVVCTRAGALLWLVTTAPVEARQLAQWLARPRAAGGLGCHDALNLDGGPSVQLHVRLPGLSLEVPGGWPVPNALVAIPRERPR